jgi:UDP-N-acetylmuramate--alanine ligase
MKTKFSYKPDAPKQHFHFVGIGGIGMSGIAEVLLHEGYQISGTDLKSNSLIQRLTHLGAQIAIGHHAQHVAQPDAIIHSSAVAHDNVELITGRRKGIPIIPRGMMLAELMRFRYGIVIAGAHGKTTTTGLTTAVLSSLDSTFIVGGQLNQVGTNARLGKSPYLIAEADESDASFLYLTPMIAIVTNIDSDHLSTYTGDFSRLKHSFVTFLQQLPFYGLAIVCSDDPAVQSILTQIDRPLLTYGFNTNAQIRAVNIQPSGLKSTFTVLRPNQKSLDVQLNLPGQHNVLNALAAIAAANALGIPDHLIQAALIQFSGINRRFQILGEFNTSSGFITLIDDYGHHPTEISATIQTIRSVWPQRRLVMVFQPHRYTRTRDLFKEFLTVLSQVDVLILLEVYSAGETPIDHADSATLVKALNAQGYSPIWIPEQKQLAKTLKKVLRDQDVLVMQGAGDITLLAEQLANGQLNGDAL